MSRLCRLKTKSHGEDGQWAYDEIVSQRKQIEALTAQVGVLKEALEGTYDYVEEAIQDYLSKYGETYRPHRLEYIRGVKNAADKALATTPESALSEVRKAEREKCAKVCSDNLIEHISFAEHFAIRKCAAAIRAMGDE